MPPPENSGVMSPRAQAIFFGLLLYILLGTLITMLALEVKLGWAITSFFILGIFACMDVLSGCSLMGKLLGICKLFRPVPTKDE